MDLYSTSCVSTLRHGSCGQSYCIFVCTISYKFVCFFVTLPFICSIWFSGYLAFDQYVSFQMIANRSIVLGIVSRFFILFITIFYYLLFYGEARLTKNTWCVSVRNKLNTNSFGNNLLSRICLIILWCSSY